MLCQACKERTATIHLTEITNGHRVETHLCQQCAQQQGLAVKAQIPLNELLSTLLSVQPQAAETSKAEQSYIPDKSCHECGMTLKRFAKESLLGCPFDYKVFEKELLPLIERSHNGKTELRQNTQSHPLRTKTGHRSAAAAKTTGRCGQKRRLRKSRPIAR